MMAGYVQDTILLFGDSITQLSTGPGGLAQQLSDVYQRKLDVLNRGFSGYNSRWAIPVFKNVFAKKSEQPNLPKVKLLTIWYGANDAVEPGGPQYVPLEEYSQNLSTLIQLVKSPSSEWYSPETRIIVLTPPPINSAQWAEFLKTLELGLDKSDRTVERTKTYADAVKEVAKKEGVAVVDVFELLWSAAGEREKALERFLTDGLHLKVEGYKLVYDALIESISQNFPELHYDKLQTAYPDWKDLSTENYAGLVKEPLVKRH
ncbi:SGNH hydrolase-type esterase domain-containing protein [Irpex rosettiformis]|uniref:SGNH hydrolase-type esterase domain-containing protein n=1 Tax=Irpex rosettiformis TaxID=378272 RepID=A0ACB8TXE0_9APHY|nr:SGNH hydrolase-type esterase domain-containing protein [Irpex rosettiformis]